MPLIGWPWKEYALLPTSPSNKRETTLPNTLKSPMAFLAVLPKRYTRLLLSVALSFGLLCIFGPNIVFVTRGHFTPKTPTIPYPQVQESPPIEEAGFPPVYNAYRQYEDLLGAEFNKTSNQRKYIFFANHAYGCGWGNVLQELIPTVLLAHESGRGYVWPDYTWNRDGSNFTKYGEKLIPSKIPMSTMIGGDILGLNAMNDRYNNTPSITHRIYEHICPLEDRVYIEKATVEQYLQGNSSLSNRLLDEGSGEQVLDAWLALLNQPDLKDARCVEVRVDTTQVFDIWIFGTPRMHDLWNRLRNSPVLQDWAWSPLIYQAYEKNQEVFLSKDTPTTTGRFDLTHPFGGGSFTTAWKKKTDHFKPLPVLALHVRRGDFVEHCNHLAQWGSTYTGWNSFPQFPDHFSVPDVNSTLQPGQARILENGDPEQVSSLEDRRRVYARHCFPDTSAIVKRVREVLHDYEQHLEENSFWWWWREFLPRWGRKARARRSLRNVYIMTNGDRQWLEDVKRALREDAERSKLTGEDHGWSFEWDWDLISTSRDLTLGWEEKPVAQALDMYVAQRAELFIGNGFSSLTAGIVMLRMNAGLDPVQIRFW